MTPYNAIQIINLKLRNIKKIQKITKPCKVKNRLLLNLDSSFVYKGPIRCFTIKENNIGLAISEVSNYRQTDILLLLYNNCKK